MLQVKKNNVIIPLKTWDELKKNNYFKDLIEVLEDSELLEKTKKASNGFVDLNEYIRNRESKEKRSSKAKRKSLNRDRLSVQSKIRK